MKKVFSTVFLGALIGTGMWAQVTNWEPQIKKLELQEGPQSVIDKATEGRFGSDIDNYLGVTDWNSVEYDKRFFFLGGAADNGANGVTGNFQGGLATKLGGSHLGVYYSGNFFDGSGNDTNPDTSSTRAITSTSTWDNSLAILFGNEGIGGIRLDMMFNNTIFNDSSRSNGDVKSASSSDHLVTSIQWGKSFGALTPKITLGFQWPSYDNSESSAGKSEEWKNAIVGFKVDVGINDFGVDYQATVDFGTTSKPAGTDESTTDGYFHNDLNLRYGITGKVDDKLTVKLQPSINLQLGLDDAKAKAGSTETQGPNGGFFKFDSAIKIAGEYAFKPTMNLYAGFGVSLFNFTSNWNNPVKDGTKDNPSEWKTAGFNAATASLGFQLKPSEAFSIEMALDNVIDVTNGKWGLNFESLGGRLAVVLKPGAGGSAQSAKE